MSEVMTTGFGLLYFFFTLVIVANDFSEFTNIFYQTVCEDE